MSKCFKQKIFSFAPFQVFFGQGKKEKTKILRFFGQKVSLFLVRLHAFLSSCFLCKNKTKLFDMMMQTGLCMYMYFVFVDPFKKLLFLPLKRRRHKFAFSPSLSMREREQKPPSYFLNNEQNIDMTCFFPACSHAPRQPRFRHTHRFVLPSCPGY